LEDAGKKRDKNIIAEKTQKFVAEVGAIVGKIEDKLAENV